MIGTIVHPLAVNDPAGRNYLDDHGSLSALPPKRKLQLDLLACPDAFGVVRSQRRAEQDWMQGVFPASFATGWRD